MRTFWSRARRKVAPVQVASAPQAPVEQEGQGQTGTMHSDPDTCDGAVWVEAGVLHVRNPQGLGRWPTVAVSPGGGTELLIDSEPRSGDVVLRAEDRVELRCRVIETPGHADVDVTEDGMAAHVTVQPGQCVRYSAADAPPTDQLDLQAIELRESQPRNVTAADVRDALREAGVSVGIVDDRIHQALQTPGTPVLVARGRPPIPGRAAGVWTHTQVELGIVAAVRTPSPPTDSGNARPFVEAGQPVAQLTPGDPAVPGETVRGEPVTPKQPWHPAMVAGPGTLKSADGYTLIAALSGHPVVKIDTEAERIYATVASERQIPGDVDGATGDIAYDGDVWVAGSVQLGRAVLVTGDAEVAGHVLQARITAGGGIWIHGGAANALLIAGGPGLTYARTLLLCEELLRTMGTTTPPADGAQGRRPAALAAGVRQALAGTDIHLDPEVEALAAVLEPFSHSATLKDTWPGSVGPDLAKLTERAIERMREVLNRPGDCTVRHLDNTRIEATGNVVVGETGAVRSHITTLGEVRVSGAFRGGTIWALRGARLTSVGGGEETQTRVDIGPHARFQATEVRPGTVVLRGGAVVRRFDAPAHEVVIAPEATR